MLESIGLLIIIILCSCAILAVSCFWRINRKNELREEIYRLKYCENYKEQLEISL